MINPSPFAHRITSLAEHRVTGVVVLASPGQVAAMASSPQVCVPGKRTNLLFLVPLCLFHGSDVLVPLSSLAVTGLPADRLTLRQANR